MAQKAYSLSHTKWMCKYHVVFTPKYRRKVIYNQIRSDLGEIFRKLCQYKGIEIIEGHLMPDHVHMLLAKSAATTISYGIFSSENAYPCTATLNYRVFLQPVTEASASETLLSSINIEGKHSDRRILCNSFPIQNV